MIDDGERMYRVGVAEPCRTSDYDQWIPLDDANDQPYLGCEAMNESEM